MRRRCSCRSCSFSISLYVPLCWYAATRPPRAIPHEGGAGEARKASCETTSDAQRSTAALEGRVRRRPSTVSGCEHDLAHVAPLDDHALRLTGPLAREHLGDDRFDRGVVEHLAQRRDPRLERLAVLPQREHVETDHGLRFGHL